MLDNVAILDEVISEGQLEDPNKKSAFYSIQFLKRQTPDPLSNVSASTTEIMLLTRFQVLKAVTIFCFVLLVIQLKLTEWVKPQSPYDRGHSDLLDSFDLDKEGTKVNGYVLLKNYIPAEAVFWGNESVTYTTHSDPTFLDNLVPLVKRWRGPVSLAIYCPGTDYDLALKAAAFYRHCVQDDDASILIRKYVTFHFFFEAKHNPELLFTGDDVWQRLSPDCNQRPPVEEDNYLTFRRTHNLTYPVNVARNLARTSAMTHFVLPSDIELYPNPGLIPAFLNMLNSSITKDNTTATLLARPNPKVFVTSIFEIEEGQEVPDTKAALLDLLAQKIAIPFHKRMCSQCHRIPDARNWTRDSFNGKKDTFKTLKASMISTYSFQKMLVQLPPSGKD